MIYEKSEFLSDSNSQYLFGSDSEQLFAKSANYYIEDVVKITSFTLNPTETTINSKFKATVKASEALEEKAY